MHGDMRWIQIPKEWLWSNLWSQGQCVRVFKAGDKTGKTFISPLNGKIYEIFRKLAAYFCKPSFIDA